MNSPPGQAGGSVQRPEMKKMWFLVLKELLDSEEDEHLWHRLLLPTPNPFLP